ncbi:hypothetical protein ACWCPT_29805 [Streptomyces sp. NPDC002308]
MAESRYPLLVALPGGRVQHAARTLGDGPSVVTLCRKRGTPTGDGDGLRYCAACNDKPNPISQQSAAQ